MKKTPVWIISLFLFLFINFGFSHKDEIAVNSEIVQNQKIYLPIIFKPVTETLVPLCRLAHDLGTLTGIPYKWGNNLQTPNSNWRYAFESALSNWNVSPTKIYFYNDINGTTIIDTYELNDDLGGYTDWFCNGDVPIGANVFANTFYEYNNPNMRQALAGHELGHAQYIGHISGAEIALMGFNPDSSIYFTAQSVDINLVNQIYP